jgi:hypothetical protein
LCHCGSDPVDREEYCREVCQAANGNDYLSSVDQCVAFLDELTAQAEGEDCSEEWEDTLSCFDDDDLCVFSNTPSTECDAEIDDLDDCMPRYTGLSGVGCGYR